jgi:hypothetical protein
MARRRDRARSDTVDRNNVAFHQALNRMFEQYPSDTSQVAAR